MAKVDDPHLEKHKEEVLRDNPMAPSLDKSEQNAPLTQEEEGQKNTQAFSQLMRKSQEVLIHMKTVFPFDLFPDTLTVDPIKINYKCNILFSSGYTESIPIANVTDVVVESSVLFSALRISFANYPTTQILVKPLWKKDAICARDIIAGLVQTEKKQVDVMNTPTTNPQTLQKLGHAIE